MKKLPLIGLMLITSTQAFALGYHEMPHVVEACKHQDKEKLRDIVAPPDHSGWRYQAEALGMSEEGFIHRKSVEVCGYALAEDPEAYWAEQAAIADREYIRRTKTTAVLYKNVYCKSGWNDDCTHSIKLLAPDGWQACNKSYTVVSERGHNDFIFTPILWYEGDPEEPDRFRGYELYLESSGSGSPLNQEGANIELRNVSLTIIPARATNEFRYEHGCEILRRSNGEGDGTHPVPNPNPGPFPKREG